MGRPPLAPGHARVYQVKMNLTEREKHLLDRYHEQRPHLTKSACARELMTFMLEVLNNPKLGTDYVIKQLGLDEEEGDKHQIHINFNVSPIMRDQVKVFREEHMDRLITNSKPPLIPQ